MHRLRTQKEIDAQKDLTRHPFYLKYQVLEKNSYKIQGEDFNEPIVTTEASYCGNHYYYQQRRIEEQRHYSSEIKSNQNGLYESYYQLYYPEDTSDAAKEMVKTTRVLRGRQKEWYTGFDIGLWGSNEISPK